MSCLCGVFHCGRNFGVAREAIAVPGRGGVTLGEGHLYAAI